MRHGEDILCSPSMQRSRDYSHHKRISVYEHSIGVAYMSLLLAFKFGLRINEKALVRGALLHDYYLYDWHDHASWHRLHGLRHPGFASKNAERDFEIGEIEKDIILKHMFPLTPVPPLYKESAIVCAVDTGCAMMEYFSYDYIAPLIKGAVL